MMHRGIADLPLHFGHVPQWLAERMTRLAKVIVELMVSEYGPSFFIERLSNPEWFQCFGCVLGMDWHSSGITTSVIGSLKRALEPISHELGVYICGGRGRYSRGTPQELLRIGELTGIDPSPFIQISRLCAKIDNNLIQDGFQIYLHAFILLPSTGEWAIIQQGMNPSCQMARRYHWYSKNIQNFLVEPHRGIIGQNMGTILNLTHSQAVSTQQTILALLRESPIKILKETHRLLCPSRHTIQANDLDLSRLGSVLTLAYEKRFQNFAEFILMEQVGPRTIQSLALIAELVYGKPAHFRDPARFAFTHGGKDGHPHPVHLKTYDETIEILHKILNQSKVDRTEKHQALKRLHHLELLIHQHLHPQAYFYPLLQKEWEEAKVLDGRTVSSRLHPPSKISSPPLFSSSSSSILSSPSFSSHRQPDLFDDLINKEKC